MEVSLVGLYSLLFFTLNALLYLTKLDNCVDVCPCVRWETWPILLWFSWKGKASHSISCQTGRPLKHHINFSFIKILQNKIILTYKWIKKKEIRVEEDMYPWTSLLISQQQDLIVVTGRVLESIPALCGERQCTPLNESPGPCDYLGIRYPAQVKPQ